MGLFSDKVVLVTGGNSGIGKAAAIAFAREGASVVIAARRIEAGEEVVKIIQSAGNSAMFVQCDVTRGDDVEKLVNTVLDNFGRLDVAFNNAGIAGDRLPLADVTEAQFDRIVDLNVKGTWWCMKHEIPAMIKNGGGCIVNCSSTAAYKTTRGISIYTTTKAALVAMSKGAAVDYARQGIRVNAVCPSIVETTMSTDYRHEDNAKAAEAVAKAHPMGRVCQPDEVANAVLWLCSENASFVTGEALVVDGGFLAV